MIPRPYDLFGYINVYKYIYMYISKETAQTLNLSNKKSFTPTFYATLGPFCDCAVLKTTWAPQPTCRDRSKIRWFQVRFRSKNSWMEYCRWWCGMFQQKPCETWTSEESSRLQFLKERWNSKHEMTWDLCIADLMFWIIIADLYLIKVDLMGLMWNYRV